MARLRELTLEELKSDNPMFATDGGSDYEGTWAIAAKCGRSCGGMLERNDQTGFKAEMIAMDHLLGELARHVIDKRVTIVRLSEGSRCPHGYTGRAGTTFSGQADAGKQAPIAVWGWAGFGVDPLAWEHGQAQHLVPHNLCESMMRELSKSADAEATRIQKSRIRISAGAQYRRELRQAREWARSAIQMALKVVHLYRDCLSSKWNS